MIDPITNVELQNLTVEEFAAYLAENKPYLIEIEEEIQKMGNFGEMEIKISIRGGRVEKVSFWKGRTWLRAKIDAIEGK